MFWSCNNIPDTSLNSSSSSSSNDSLKQSSSSIKLKPIIQLPKAYYERSSSTTQIGSYPQKDENPQDLEDDNGNDQTPFNSVGTHLQLAESGFNPSTFSSFSPFPPIASCLKSAFSSVVKVAVFQPPSKNELGNGNTIYELTSKYFTDGFFNTTASVTFKVPVEESPRTYMEMLLFRSRVNDYFHEKTLVYAHSVSTNFNHSTTCDNLRALSEKLQCNICTFEYPGYGSDRNVKFSDEGCLKHAEIAYTVLKKIMPENHQFILCGFSMGTSVITHLASRHEELNTIILLAPFRNLLDAIVEYVPGFLRGAFNSLLQNTDMDSFKTQSILSLETMSSKRFLIFHGDTDQAVNASHSIELRTCISDASQLFVVDGYTHDNMPFLMKDKQLVRKIQSFVSSQPSTEHSKSSYIFLKFNQKEKKWVSQQRYITASTYTM
jgi:predicted esterase